MVLLPKTFLFTSKTMLINVQSYAKGVYTLEIEGNEDRVYKKLLVE
jgi:hypothetical protein